jgi:hypothetical protein
LSRRRADRRATRHQRSYIRQRTSGSEQQASTRVPRPSPGRRPLSCLYASSGRWACRTRHDSHAHPADSALPLHHLFLPGGGHGPRTSCVVPLSLSVAPGCPRTPSCRTRDRFGGTAGLLLFARTVTHPLVPDGWMHLFTSSPAKGIIGGSTVVCVRKPRATLR